MTLRKVFATVLIAVAVYVMIRNTPRQHGPALPPAPGFYKTGGKTCLGGLESRWGVKFLRWGVLSPMPSHGSLTKAGKVRNQTPKIPPKPKKDLPPRRRNIRNYKRKILYASSQASAPAEA
jgi:small subunit ribosomal protein S30e